MGLCFLWTAGDFSPMKGGAPETKGESEKNQYEL